MRAGGAPSYDSVDPDDGRRERRWPHRGVSRRRRAARLRASYARWSLAPTVQSGAAA